MLKIIFLTVFAISTVLADGELIILHNPESVKFDGTQTINQSFLKEVFTVILGYTAKLTQPWDGVTIRDPFSLPEAVVSIAIEGVESLESPRGKHFPLNVDEVEETTWQAVSRRLEERDNNNTLVRICVGDGLNALGHSALGELKPSTTDESSLKHLSLKNDEDKKFIEELQLLRAIAQKIPSTITANSKPDVYWFVVSGLRPVMDLHGKDSEATKEALNLLNNALRDVSNAFTEIYDGQVVIAVFTNDANKLRDTRSIHSRVRREVKAAELPILSHAARYSPHYPVMFNIFLWFGVIFFFSLLAVCIAIAGMDPGRDSIIYRMTSNRMKKDN